MISGDVSIGGGRSAIGVVNFSDGIIGDGGMNGGNIGDRGASHGVFLMLVQQV